MLPIPSESASSILAKVGAAWQPFRAAIDDAAARLHSTTPSGWTGKELLAHVAFWDEAVMASGTTMFRGQALPAGFAFGSGFQPDAGAWPATDEHNAREAEWGRAHSPAEVLARCDAANEGLLAFLGTVTDDEAREHAHYFDEIGAHYREHLPELESLLRP